MRPAQTRSHSTPARAWSSVDADLVGELAEEPRATGRQRVEHRLVELRVLERRRRRQGERGLVGQVQGDPAVVAGQVALAGPDHLARGGQLVEVGGLVVAHPGGQHQLLERRRGHRRAGELVDRGEHAVDAAQPAASVTTSRRRPTARRAGSAPAPAGRPARPPCAAGPASAAAAAAAPRRRTTRSRCRRAGTRRRAPGPGPASRCRVWRATAAPSPRRVGELGDGEGAVGAGVAGDQVAERVVDGLGEGLGDAWRHGHAEARRAAGRRPRPRPSAPRRPSGPGRRAGVAPEPRRDSRRRRCRATERATISSTVSGPSRRSRSATPSTSRARRSGGEPLQLGLDLGEHLGVEQLAQLGAAEQLGQQALVERRAPRPGARRSGSRLRRRTGRRSRTAASGRRATGSGSRCR